MADYKSLTELTAFTGNVALTDQILISRSESGNESDYVSYHTSVNSFAAALSATVKDALAQYTQSGLAELAYLNHAQIEATGTNPLTTYVSCGNEDAGIITADNMCAISSITWDKTKKLTHVEGIDLNALSASIISDVSSMLKARGINDGIVFSDNTSGKGVKLATINGNSIYSGAPQNLLKVDSLTDSGTAIAKMTYSDGSEITLKNDLTAKTIAPEFGDKVYCGDQIAEISGIVIRNNLSVTSNTSRGQCIANINGKDIYNDLSVTTVLSGIAIANINGNVINNGVVVSDTASIGKKICTINDKDIYNNVDVTDNTSQSGNLIATVNGTNLYNNVVVTTSGNQTYINGEKVLAGVKLGTVTPKTYTGDVIATIETNDSTVNIYNGNSYTDVLKSVYPVGSIYLTVNSSNPATLFGFGTWKQVSQGRCLWGTSNTSKGGQTIEAGLPNINGTFGNCEEQSSSFNGAFLPTGTQGGAAPNGYFGGGYNVIFNASWSNPIYGKSATVQPPAFQVNIWQRTA